MDWLGTVVATFLASAVEVVEVVTIVLALGITRGWRSTLLGVGAATVLLAGLTALFGTALERWIDIHVLEVIIGSLLVIFGLQWLRKAILRSSGFKALNDEDALFREEVANAQSAPIKMVGSLDWFAFTVAFKGMLLEGLEIVFIVMTIGSSSGELGLAAGAAIAAAIIVGIAGVILRNPLSRVPENTLKFCVGLLLTTFGTFWAGEGVGIHWLGDDLALLWLLAGFALASYAAVRYLSTQHPVSTAAAH
ncbi:MAG: COG4280 domain-containing protein [Thermomicrobiales bacterium]